MPPSKLTVEAFFNIKSSAPSWAKKGTAVPAQFTGRILKLVSNCENFCSASPSFLLDGCAHTRISVGNDKDNTLGHHPAQTDYFTSRIRVWSMGRYPLHSGQLQSGYAALCKTYLYRARRLPKGSLLHTAEITTSRSTQESQAANTPSFTANVCAYKVCSPNLQALNATMACKGATTIQPHNRRGGKRPRKEDRRLAQENRVASKQEGTPAYISNRQKKLEESEVSLISQIFSDTPIIST